MQLRACRISGTACAQPRRQLVERRSGERATRQEIEALRRLTSLRSMRSIGRERLFRPSSVPRPAPEPRLAHLRIRHQRRRSKDKRRSLEPHAHAGRAGNRRQEAFGPCLRGRGCTEPLNVVLRAIVPMSCSC